MNTTSAAASPPATATSTSTARRASTARTTTSLGPGALPRRRRRDGEGSDEELARPLQPLHRHAGQRARVHVPPRRRRQAEVGLPRTLHALEVLLRRPAALRRPRPGDDRIDDLHDFDVVRTNGAVDFIAARPEAAEDVRRLPAVSRRGRHEPPPSTSTAATRSSCARRSTAACTSPSRAPSSTRSGTSFFFQQQYRRTIRSFGDHGPEPGDAQGSTRRTTRRSRATTPTAASTSTSP